MWGSLGIYASCALKSYQPENIAGSAVFLAKKNPLRGWREAG